VKLQEEQTYREDEAETTCERRQAESKLNVMWRLSANGLYLKMTESSKLQKKGAGSCRKGWIRR
jgi:hypothetical protein